MICMNDSAEKWGLAANKDAHRIAEELEKLPYCHIRTLDLFKSSKW